LTSGALTISHIRPFSRAFTSKYIGSLLSNARPTPNSKLDRHLDGEDYEVDISNYSDTLLAIMMPLSFPYKSRQQQHLRWRCHGQNIIAGAGYVIVLASKGGMHRHTRLHIFRSEMTSMPSSKSANNSGGSGASPSSLPKLLQAATMALITFLNDKMKGAKSKNDSSMV